MKCDDLEFTVGNTGISFYKDWQKHRWYFRINAIRNAKTFTNKEGKAVLTFLKILDTYQGVEDPDDEEADI